MAEHYVRPPLIAREARPDKLAVWRFRIIALLVLAVLAGALVYLLIKGLGIGNEDPGFGSLRSLTQQAAAG